MISIKKFAMAVMLIAGFQQASADVCKLKVNAEIMRHFDKHGNFIFIDNKKPNWSNTASNGFILVRLNENGNVTSEARHNRLRAIYCNKDGEIVINLKGIKSENERKVEAKRQFENIIKCGLIVEAPQYYVNNNEDRFLSEDNGKTLSNISTLNPMIFSTPFVKTCNYSGQNVYRRRSNRNRHITPREGFINELKKFQVEENTYYAVLEDLQMPGISAFIKDGENTTNVYCAMKKKSDGVANGVVWNTYKWNGWLARQGGLGLLTNYEHTERQLLMYYLSCQNAERWSPGDAGWHVMCRMTYNDTGHLLMYTKGAPCYEHKIRDNGDMSCWELYDKFKRWNIHTDVYFTDLNVAVISAPANIGSMLIDNFDAIKGRFGNVANEQDENATRLIGEFRQNNPIEFSNKVFNESVNWRNTSIKFWNL